MSKALLNFLTVGFFLVLASSEIRYANSADNTCVGRKKLLGRSDCTQKNICGPTCSKLDLEGPSKCIVTQGVVSGVVLYTKYECECCKCAATKIVNVNNCNLHKCEERCVIDGRVWGPSECRTTYDGFGNYVHKCYCCDDEKKLTAGNTVAVA